MPPTEASSPIDVVKGRCRARGVGYADIVGPRRSRWLMQVRREAAADLRSHFPQMSLCDIAGFLGRKDHTTAANLLGVR